MNGPVFTSGKEEDVQEAADAAAIPDTVERAAHDCAVAKRKLKILERDARDARDEMDAARERLMAFAHESGTNLHYCTSLSYKVGEADGFSFPLVLQLRPVKAAAIYSDENRKRYDELVLTRKALDDEIKAIPADDYERTWQVWLVEDAPEKPKGKKVK